MRGLLVLRPGALGDALVAVPALVALRRALPGGRIVVAGNREALRLLDSGVIDEVLRFDDPRLTPLFVPGPIPAETRALLDGIDGVVAWLSDFPAVAPQITALGLRAIAAAPQPPDDANAPGEGPAWYRVAGGAIARHLVRSLEPLGVVEDAALYSSPLLRPTAQDTAEATAALRQIGLGTTAPTVVHAGSGGARKRWRAAEVAALLDALNGEGWSPVLLAGPADAEAVEAIRAERGATVPVLSGLPLSGVLGLLGQARGYIGMDSGISHLAGLAGTRTVAIFGPSNRWRWAPCGPDVRVVDAAQAGCLRPCLAGTACTCLADLPAEVVLAAFGSEASDGRGAT